MKRSDLITQECFIILTARFTSGERADMQIAQYVPLLKKITHKFITLDLYYSRCQGQEE
jgi:hypothetical protein